MAKEIPIDNRKIILSYILDNPGSYMRKIARDLGMSLSTLRYHLEYLEKKGEVVCQRQNNLKVYFISDKLKPHEKVLIPILQQKHYRDIILNLIEAPGLTPSQIADKLSVSNSSASKYISLLEDQEILFHRRSGREKNYFVNDEKSIIELMTRYKKFVADVDHGVRTPMNTIMGMTRLLLEEDISSEQKKDYIEAIRKSGEAMMVLINDIFDLTKTDKEGVVLEHQPFNLRGCIEESMDLVSAQAIKKGLNMVFAIEYGTPDTIVGDHGKLRNVLVNLLSNAVKFTDTGEIDVSISSKDLGDNKFQISFAIKDTGIGITPDKIDHIFQSDQAEIDVSQTYDGAGLGLPISKRLVELMDGTIQAESELGIGSTFGFTIEVGTVSGRPTKLEDSNKPIENLAERYPLRILVAEDDPYNQKVLLEMLRKMGYGADAVADGTEVLKALEIQPYDLILMDIKMPHMDGIKATHEIRKRWPNNGPKIVAITAYAMPGDKERFLGAGMDDYIAKPIAIDNLAVILSKYQPSNGSL